MCQNFILLNMFIKKFCFKWFCNQKGKVSTSSWWCFCVFRLAGSHIWLPGGYWEWGRGRGALTASPLCFPLVAWELYMTPSHTATNFFYSPSGLGLSKNHLADWPNSFLLELWKKLCETFSPHGFNQRNRSGKVLCWDISEEWCLHDRPKEATSSRGQIWGHWLRSDLGQIKMGVKCPPLPVAHDQRVVTTGYWQPSFKSAFTLSRISQRAISSLLKPLTQILESFASTLRHLRANLPEACQ